MNEHGEQLETKQSFERITKFILDLHQKFDDGRCDKGESFHNHHHIEAVLKAAVSLVEAVNNGNDPLELKKQLDQWNNKNPGARINGMEELLEVVYYAFLWHDLGNICQDIKIENGSIVPTYLSEYQAKGSEERAKTMAEKLVLVCIEDKGKRERYLPLILHLIEQTKFIPEPQNQLFNQFVQVVDQIGNAVFINPEQRIKQVVGLLNEMISENPNATYKPDDFFNFYHKRFSILVPDEKTREEILKIWCLDGGTIPDEIKGLSRDGVPIVLNNLPKPRVSLLNNRSLNN